MGSKSKFNSKNLNALNKAPVLSRSIGNSDTRHGSGRLVVIGKTGNRGFSKSGMAIPAPINTPSLRKENNGQDISVSLVPSGGSGWGASTATEVITTINADEKSLQYNVQEKTIVMPRPAPWATSEETSQVETSKDREESIGERIDWFTDSDPSFATGRWGDDALEEDTRSFCRKDFPDLGNEVSVNEIPEQPSSNDRAYHRTIGHEVGISDNRGMYVESAKYSSESYHSKWRETRFSSNRTHQDHDRSTHGYGRHQDYNARDDDVLGNEVSVNEIPEQASSNDRAYHRTVGHEVGLSDNRGMYVESAKYSSESYHSKWRETRFSSNRTHQDHDRSTYGYGRHQDYNALDDHGSISHIKVDDDHQNNNNWKYSHQDYRETRTFYDRRRDYPLRHESFGDLNGHSQADNRGYRDYRENQNLGWRTGRGRSSSLGVRDLQDYHHGDPNYPKDSDGYNTRTIDRLNDHKNNKIPAPFENKNISYSDYNNRNNVNTDFAPQNGKDWRSEKDRCQLDWGERFQNSRMHHISRAHDDDCGGQSHLFNPKGIQTDIIENLKSTTVTRTYDDPANQVKDKTSQTSSLESQESEPKKQQQYDREINVDIEITELPGQIMETASHLNENYHNEDVSKFQSNTNELDQTSIGNERKRHHDSALVSSLNNRPEVILRQKMLFDPKTGELVDAASLPSRPERIQTKKIDKRPEKIGDSNKSKLMASIKSQSDVAEDYQRKLVKEDSKHKEHQKNYQGSREPRTDGKLFKYNDKGKLINTNPNDISVPEILKKIKPNSNVLKRQKGDNDSSPKIESCSKAIRESLVLNSEKDDDGEFEEVKSRRKVLIERKEERLKEEKRLKLKQKHAPMKRKSKKQSPNEQPPPVLNSPIHDTATPLSIAVENSVINSSDNLASVNLHINNSRISKDINLGIIPIPCSTVPSSPGSSSRHIWEPIEPIKLGKPRSSLNLYNLDKQASSNILNDSRLKWSNEEVIESKVIRNVESPCYTNDQIAKEAMNLLENSFSSSSSAYSSAQTTAFIVPPYLPEIETENNKLAWIKIDEDSHCSIHSEVNKVDDYGDHCEKAIQSNKAGNEKVRTINTSSLKNQSKKKKVSKVRSKDGAEPENKWTRKNETLKLSDKMANVMQSKDINDEITSNNPPMELRGMKLSPTLKYQKEKIKKPSQEITEKKKNKSKLHKEDLSTKGQKNIQERKSKSQKGDNNVPSSSHKATKKVYVAKAKTDNQ